MIPLRDYVPTRRFPVVTALLLAANIIVFLFELFLDALGALDIFIYTFGVVPYRVTHQFNAMVAFSFVSSMFLHGGFIHIASNMLYLWIFGNNVEDVMGRLRFLIFYLLTGVLAMLAQVFASANSRIPGIGASGAIAGVLAAYLVFYPHARVATLIPIGFFIRVAELPAFIVLGFWFLLQLLNGVLSFGMSETGGVAWFAHIGGFVAGLILALFFAPRGPRARISYYR